MPMPPRSNPPLFGRHDSSGATVASGHTIATHKAMYRCRAKLRDILVVIDRERTGVISKEKFHRCLELADLPIPDRSTEVPHCYVTLVFLVATTIVAR